MAEEDDQKPGQLSLSEQLLAEEEQDTLFKAQMKVANFFLGYWKHMLGVLGVALLGVLAYGLWEAYVEEQQQEIHEKIAVHEAAVGAELLIGFGYGFPLPPDEDQPSAVNDYAAVAGNLQALADESDGTGAAYARLRATTFWKAGGRMDMAGTTLEQAVQDETDGILAWSAQAQLASVKAQRGDVDGAAAIYQEVSSEGDDAIVQEALYLLGRLYFENDREAEGIQVWQDLVGTYPMYRRTGELQVLINEHQISG